MTRRIIHLESDSNVTLCGNKADGNYALSKDMSVRDVNVLWYKTGLLVLRDLLRVREDVSCCPPKRSYQMKVLYPDVEHSYDCDILPCCECGDMMDEDRSDAWFVCVECAESDKGLDWMWSEYINFLYGDSDTWTHTRPHGRLAYSTGSAVSSSLSISEVTLSDRTLNILCLPVRAASYGPPFIALCGRKCGYMANDIFMNRKGPQDASLSWHTRYINYAICYDCAKLYPLQVLSGSAPYHSYGA
jgi:hypothetical protein